VGVEFADRRAKQEREEINQMLKLNEKNLLAGARKRTQCLIGNNGKTSATAGQHIKSRKGMNSSGLT